MRAIIFSDIHFHHWEKHNKGNKRLRAQLQVFERLCRVAHTYKVPLIFGGDFFNNNLEITNKLLNYVIANFKVIFSEYPIDIYAISGNHDMSEKNTLTHRSPSYVKALAEIYPNIHMLDFTQKAFEDFTLWGIPYLEDNAGLAETVNEITPEPTNPSILLIHTGFRGQKDTSGVIVSDGFNVKEDIFKKFSLVISGHIHKPGHIRKNLYSIGAPMQLRASDSGGKFGYWVLKDDFSLKFKELDNTPKFRFFSDPSEIDNEDDIWIRKPVDNNGAEVVSVESVSIDPIQVSTQFCKETGVISKRKIKTLINLIEEANDYI